MKKLSEDGKIGALVDTLAAVCIGGFFWLCAYIITLDEAGLIIFMYMVAITALLVIAHLHLGGRRLVMRLGRKVDLYIKRAFERARKDVSVKPGKNWRL